MPLASVEYENEQSDLAIISFRFSEDLDAAEVAKDNPKKGDKIVAVGNPSNIEGHFIQDATGPGHYRCNQFSLCSNCP